MREAQELLRSCSVYKKDVHGTLRSPAFLILIVSPTGLMVLQFNPSRPGWTKTKTSDLISLPGSLRIQFQKPHSKMIREPFLARVIKSWNELPALIFNSSPIAFNYKYLENLLKQKVHLWSQLQVTFSTEWYIFCLNIYVVAFSANAFRSRFEKAPFTFENRNHWGNRFSNLCAWQRAV